MGSENDYVLLNACRFIIKARANKDGIVTGATSWLQRQLQCGYNRAARILEELEDAGFISAAQDRGTRQIKEWP